MALRVEERIVAGGDDDPIVVHHLVLRGSNRAIGRHLGEIAKSRYHLALRPSADPLRAHTQREWLRRHAPVLVERMRGVADAFGVDAEDDRIELARLGADAPAAHCSAVFLPPASTASGHPLVSRTFDLPPPAGRVPPGGPPTASRPYVIETWPDQGHAALALVAFDLLCAALDGVNAAGLCVVAAPDLETFAGAPAVPDGAGLDGLQLGRLLLDGCGTAQEARELLLAAEHPAAAVPVHWLVADRSGDAFVLELGPGRNRVRLVDAAGAPLVVTNHPLHRYPGDVGLPRGEGPGGTYARYRALRAALAETPAPWTVGTLATAAARAYAGPERGPERTLWHAIYDLGAPALEATFFRRDEPDRAIPGALRAVRTPALRFALSS